ncbi:MrpH family fimbial adhesin [Enterobacter cancerogenus]|uniref:MrpH family fimbial adhesin n=1 Tax=Enterobacter cancerogenus TaxID=69218 RepID=UPI00235DF17E|nr:hypothetical protein [Enterobacter cancerogenus]
MKFRYFVINTFIFSLSFIPVCKAFINIEKFNWHIGEDGAAVIDSVTATGDSSPLCLGIIDDSPYCALYLSSSNLHPFQVLVFDYKDTMTTRKVAAELNSLHGYKLPLSFNVTKNSRLCPYRGTWGGGNTALMPLPGAACGGGGQPPAPSPSLVCNANDINIDYGKLDKDTVNGAIKQDVLNLNCSGNGVVHIYSANYDPINGLKLSDSGGLRSFLTVDGNDLKKGVVVEGTNISKNLNIISTLKTSGSVDEGSYQASIIINIDVQ